MVDQPNLNGPRKSLDSKLDAEILRKLDSGELNDRVGLIVSIKPASYTPTNIQQIRDLGVDVTSEGASGVLTATVPVDILGELADLPYVIRIQGPQKLSFG